MLRVRNLPEDRCLRARHVLDPNVLTLGWARRFATYKRPNLLLSDPDRLARLLLDAERPVQIVFAGKAHPDDGHGREMVRELARYAFREDLRDRMVFLEDYDMVLGQHLAAGVDVWLNSPRRPNEASGTSGMKMLVNGGLNASTLDGWWDEAYSPEVGWAIGDAAEHGPEHDWEDASSLYALLEEEIAPRFYERDAEGLPRAWLARVRASMSRLTEPFSSDRMVRQYVDEAYLPAAAAFRLRAEAGAREAGRLEAWHRRIRDEWSSVRLGPMQVAHSGEHWEVDIQLYLAELGVEDVRVELVREASGGSTAMTVPMTTDRPITGAVNVWRYRASVPADRPAADYTPRVVPAHPLAFVPVEASEILWWERSAGLTFRDGKPSAGRDEDGTHEAGVEPTLSAA
jgi:starch phosphorylase